MLLYSTYNEAISLRSTGNPPRFHSVLDAFKFAAKGNAENL